LFKFWKKIYGINLWKLNRRLLKLASSNNLLEEQFKNGVFTIYLKPLQSSFFLGIEQKKEIEKTISELEGFEILKLVLLEECVPIYKEQRNPSGISRWIEIHIKRQVVQNKNQRKVS
jgi:hypothetical protein